MIYSLFDKEHQWILDEQDSISARAAIAEADETERVHFWMLPSSSSAMPEFSSRSFRRHRDCGDGRA